MADTKAEKRAVLGVMAQLRNDGFLLKVEVMRPAGRQNIDCNLSDRKASGNREGAGSSQNVGAMDCLLRRMA